MLRRMRAAWAAFWKEEENLTSDGVSGALMRHLLGSIDTSEVRGRPSLTPEERKQYEQTVAAFFPHVIDPAVKRLIADQEWAMARGLGDMRAVGIVDPAEQVLFGRGTINGLSLVHEEFRDAYHAYVNEIENRGEKFDPHKLFPELFGEGK